jgi:CHC2 zinc finger
MNINIKKEALSKDFILSRVNPMSIFSYYMPNEWKLNRRCINPFVSKDNNPSMIIGDKNGEMIFKCFNSNNQGDCFAFVMQMFNINFTQALDKIASDFKLLSSDSDYERVIQNLPKVDRVKSVHNIIQCAPFSEWKDYHLDYLKRYTLEPKDLQFCEDTKAYPLKDYWVNKRKMVVNKDELGFFYNAGNHNKVYFPNRPKEDKWKSTIPFTYIHGLNNMKGCKVGILTKSLKDGAILSKYITKCVCVIQAENVTSISKENAEFLKQNVEQLYVAMDCDPPGKSASYAICDYLGAKHINPPDYLLDKKATDFADWVALEGIEPMINHFKTKIKEL